MKKLLLPIIQLIIRAQHIHIILWVVRVEYLHMLCWSQIEIPPWMKLFKYRISIELWTQKSNLSENEVTESKWHYNVPSWLWGNTENSRKTAGLYGIAAYMRIGLNSRFVSIEFQLGWIFNFRCVHIGYVDIGISFSW